MSDDADFIVTLRFPAEQDREQNFHTASELASWVKGEKEFFAWLSGKGAPIQGHWRTMVSNWDAVLHTLESFEEGGRPVADVCAEVQNQLNQIYAHHIGLTSSDPRAQFASTLAERDPAAPQVLLAFIRPNEVAHSTPDGVRALVRAAVFEIGLDSSTVASEQSALEKVHEDSRGALRVLTDEYDRFRELVAESSGEIARIREGQVSEFRAFMEEAGAQRESLEKTYDEGLALRKPVEYWKRKVSEYRSRALGFGVAFVVLLGLSGTGLYFAVTLLLPRAAEVGAEGSWISWPVLVAVVVITLALWPLRIVSRVLLSSLHLGTDAEERVVLAQTYLALLREDKAMTPGDRSLVLGALFRPSATGIVKDDGAPPSLGDQITKLGVGR